MKPPINQSGRSEDTALATPGQGPAHDPTFYLPKVEPSRFVGSVLRRGWIMLLFGLLAGAGAWAFFSKLPKTYRSTGSVYVSTQAPQILDIRAVAAEESRDLEQLHSVEQALNSTTVLLRVIEKHGLLGDSSFSEDAETEQEVLAVLAERVNVELVRGSRNIEVAVKDTDPERARQMVESIISEYESVRSERMTDIISQAGVGLAREEQLLRDRMEESARKIEDFRKSNAVPGLDDPTGRSGLSNALSDLSTQLTRAKSDRLRLEAEFEAFEEFDAQDPNALAGLGRSDHAAEVISLMRSLRDKEVEFERLKERYLHKHPAYKEAANEIAGLEKALSAAVQTAGEAVKKSYRIAVDNQTKLEQEVALASNSAVDVEGVRADFVKLTREAEADRVLHASVAKRLRETSLSASVPASVLSWRERPFAPEKAYGPGKMLFVPLAAIGGFFFGLVAVVGLELGDRRVRDTAAATRATGLPLFARLPAMNDVNGMVLLNDPNSEAAESFRRLRSMLMPQGAKEGLQTVLFTSARNGEGKSTCALNHAVSLATQGYRTLLLDADLRSPGLSREHLMEGHKNRGLGDFLAGDASAADACFSTAVPKLYLMSSGEMKDDAAELLSGTRFPALLEDAYRWFDRIVIDAPAVLSASDAQAIARYADRTCMVVSEAGGDYRELRQTADLLRTTGANLVGLVWNEGAARGNSDPGPSVTVSRNVIEAPSEECSEEVEATESHQPTIPFPVEKKA
ncbi:GumC family protein [Haloferula sp.]|uniref:GumC family protein n=1 Tax=Haloferula sp. TaxID=2497595 RepID=UPI00329BEA97